MLIELKDARLILVASNCKDEPIEVYQTEDQFIAIENHRFVAVCANYDFDYRPLAGTLNDEVVEIRFASWDAMQIVEDWLAVECDCVDLCALIAEYFEEWTDRILEERV